MSNPNGEQRRELNLDHLAEAFDRLEADIHTGMWEHEVRESDDDQPS